ncbi:MAG: hypothetical protein ISR65_17240 [Bacteriovoracaceae bacterium]|nr:hypothetical protein [Bacteriovoracaceae bacterium]
MKTLFKILKILKISFIRLFLLLVFFQPEQSLASLNLYRQTRSFVLSNPGSKTITNCTTSYEVTCELLGTFATLSDIQSINAKITSNTNMFSSYTTNKLLTKYAKKDDLGLYAKVSSLSSYLSDEDAKKQYATKEDLSVLEKDKNILAEEVKSNIAEVKTEAFAHSQEIAKELSNLALSEARKSSDAAKNDAIAAAESMTNTAVKAQTESLSKANKKIGKLETILATLQKKLTACPRKCLDSIPSTQQEVREKAECLHNGLNLWETNQKAIEKRCVVDLVLMQLELAHKHATKLTTEQIVRIEDLLDRYPYYRPIDREPLF